MRNFFFFCKKKKRKFIISFHIDPSSVLHFPVLSLSSKYRLVSTNTLSASFISDFPLRFAFMDLEKEGGAMDSSAEIDVGSSGGPISEPYVGMEFDSEDDARRFYAEYARRVGFFVRVMQRRRSGIDGRTLARRLGCNKQGFSPNQRGGSLGLEKKPRPSAREGCNATILVKMEKSGKWVVTRFVKEHNHPLVVSTNGFSTEGDKDKKIAELTMELERQEQLCATYREKLLSFMKNIEDETEELSGKIQVIVENVRRVESEVQKHSRHR